MGTNRYYTNYILNHCESEGVVRFDIYKGLQKYICKFCKRIFKAGADAFHGKIQSEYVSSTFNMYHTGMSINEIRNLLKQEHGYYPSKSVVLGWVQKYTDLATKQFKNHHRQVRAVLVPDEAAQDVDGQHKLWFYNIINTKIRYFWASNIALSRTTNDTERLMEDAHSSHRID